MTTRVPKPLKPAELADAMISVAQDLERAAKELKKDATNLRKGHYLPSFAFAFTRSKRYRVAEALDQYLPEDRAPGDAEDAAYRRAYPGWWAAKVV